jgi:hypothetical protein
LGHLLIDLKYDTLTSQDRWNEMADVILANPPFMSKEEAARLRKIKSAKWRGILGKPAELTTPKPRSRGSLEPSNHAQKMPLWVARGGRPSRVCSELPASKGFHFRLFHDCANDPNTGNAEAVSGLWPVRSI